LYYNSIARIDQPSYSCEYIICFTQYDADAAGLAPHYPVDRLGGIKPRCYDQEPSLPDPSAGTPRNQYVAIVIKRASGILVEAVSDLPQLGLAVEEDRATHQIEIRNVRWGMEATLKKDNKTFRLLAVIIGNSIRLVSAVESGDALG
jgi:hypothetical protein